ncbi:putative transcriptional regulator YdeE [Cytobacillus purgationiresistens]|uniref:Transcriptional regulator YdeE n=1 Tax=Cytobacillus purgationiresistens TaxID=863449 RepID=A0ABU0AAQ4_9BACI|nr:putative transcriptional regulator YdeE [Cytobacillus purgationiresistens]
MQIKTINQLKALSNIQPQGLISASTSFSEGRNDEKGDLYHMIGAADGSFSFHLGSF